MSKLSIKLEGYPEKVQRIADALEDTFPGLICWVQTFDRCKDVTIAIEGYENPSITLQTLRRNAA